MITTIFFDIDGTLMDFKAAERAAFCRAMQQHGIGSEQERYPRYSAYNRGLWEKLERGELTKDELLDHRFENFFRMEGISCNPGNFEKSYRENLSQEHVLMNGAEEILAYLSEKYAMYVVTNGIAATQHRRLRDSGIDRYFQGVFISEEIGFAKPDEGFFRHALAHAGSPAPSEVIIIGDSVTSDMLGGFCAGLKTCWMRGVNPQKHPGHPVDYEITELLQLKGIL